MKYIWLSITLTLVFGTVLTIGGCRRGRSASATTNNNESHWRKTDTASIPPQQTRQQSEKKRQEQIGENTERGSYASVPPGANTNSDWTVRARPRQMSPEEWYSSNANDQNRQMASQTTSSRDRRSREITYEDFSSPASNVYARTSSVTNSDNARASEYTHTYVQPVPPTVSPTDFRENSPYSFTTLETPSAQHLMAGPVMTDRTLVESRQTLGLPSQLISYESESIPPVARAIPVVLRSSSNEASSMSVASRKPSLSIFIPEGPRVEGIYHIPIPSQSHTQSMLPNGMPLKTESLSADSSSSMRRDIYLASLR